jgi:hypothetical protein
VKYSLDTSAFIVPFRHWPAPDLMQTLWDKYDLLIHNGDIVASREVHTEIERIDDELLEWVNDRKQMFIEVDSEQQHTVEEIVNKFPTWINPNSTNNNADPYVIALAFHNGLIVVSNERGGSQTNPSIPFVCEKFHVKHLGLNDFLREVGWQA